MQRLQLRALGLAGALGHHAGRIAFQQREQVVDVRQVLLGHLGDVGAAPHLHGHQAFGGQHLQGLAQGRAADAVFLGQLEFVDPAARLQFAAEDPLAQELGHLFIEGAGGQGDGGHGLNCTSKSCLN
ncbi:hypothetical protein D9M69_589230 [compost metagenome]